MPTFRPLILALALLAVLQVAAAPMVTQKNLLESERFWPYHVALVEAWTPRGVERALAKGTRGVLIRVEASGLARVDFGRDGLYEVPVAKTDLIAAANRIREGAGEEKNFPNLVLAIGPRMVDPVTMVAPGPARLTQNRFFVCVFADPSAEGYGELAKALASLPERPEVARVLFPQGQKTDAELGTLLRSSGWKGTFVYASMAQEYTRSLLPDAAAPPYLQLATNEGRVLFEGALNAAGVANLAAALDRALARPPTDATASQRASASQP
jgi:hypothetical protein